METLQVLEQRIIKLIALTKKLQDENAYLQQKLETLESSMLQDDQNFKALNNEREQTMLTVDELIKNIDALVGEEQHS